MLIMEHKPVEESDLHLIENACDALTASDSTLARTLFFLDPASFVVALGHIHTVMNFSIASRKHARDLGAVLATFPYETKCTICDVAQNLLNAHDSPLLDIVLIAMGLPDAY